MVQKAVNKFHGYRVSGQAAGLQPAERGAGRCSPQWAGMCWQDAVATGGEGGSGPPAAANIGLFPCPLFLTLTPFLGSNSTFFLFISLQGFISTPAPTSA